MTDQVATQSANNGDPVQEPSNETMSKVALAQMIRQSEALENIGYQLNTIAVTLCDMSDLYRRRG